ncbi:MAG: TolC family outer membrane protein [Magnetococcales bacterium]|nr:TolC family outer membrane protein [Magnetococcales bacterium]
MRTSWKIAWGVIAALLPPTVALADAGDAFRSLVEQTLADNPRVHAAQASLAAARERLNQARGSLLPEVGLDLQQGHNKATWNGGVNGSEPQMVSLNLTQPVYDQRALVALRQAPPYVAAFEQTLAAERQGVFLQVADVSLNYLKALEVARLAGNNREVTQRNLETTQDRFRVGEITQTDVSQASSRLASAEADLLRAQNDVAVGKAKFEEVVGHPPPPELAIPPLDSPLLKESLANLVREAQQRPDLQAAQLRSEVANLNIDMERSGFFPSLALTSATNRNWRQEVAGRADPVDQVTITLDLKVPLYSGGKTTSQVEQARAEYLSREVERERLLRQIAREVEQALLTYKSTQAVVVAYEAAEKAATQAMTGIEQEYRVGSRTALDLLVAQNVVFTSQTDLAKGKFDLILAQFQLLQAIGRLIPQEINFNKKPSS